MANWSARQVLALLLAVFVTLGISLSVVQASSMAPAMAATSITKMSMADASGHDGCKDCADLSPDGVKAVACGSSCVAPTFALLPLASASSFAQTSPMVAKRHLSLIGLASAPEPYPPRPSDLG